MNKQNTFTFNHIEKTIVGTKSAIKRANIFGSDEYKLLAKMMKEQPTYTVAEKVLNKKVSSKKTYNGLTLSKMKEYIETQPNSEKNLIRFEAVKKVAKAKNALYPLTKQWFLNTFPTYNDRIVLNEDTEIEVSESDLESAAAEIEALDIKIS